MFLGFLKFMLALFTCSLDFPRNKVGKLTNCLRFANPAEATWRQALGGLEAGKLSGHDDFGKLPGAS